MTVSPVFDFDTLIERRGTGSAKWGAYPADVLPMWVADMDFQAPPAVLEALRASVEHGVFGYAFPPAQLTETLVQRMQTRYGWQIAAEDILYTPGVMVSVNMAARAFAQEGALLIQPPVYHPFHYTPQWSNCGKQEAPLTRVETPDGGFSYSIDFDALEAAITPQTKMFLLCNPHNPIGRVWSREELMRIADICERHDLIICADEIHSDLIFSGHTHIPIASLSPEIAARTVTLIAPSKTFNLPGLSLSVVIVQNAALRKRFVDVGAGLVMVIMGEHSHPFINSMGYLAADAAYREGDAWLHAALQYIEANRDFARAYIQEHMPAIKVAALEGTYLQWLDFRALDLPELPAKWFVEHAKVALNEGEMFGEGGAGFARMNLATQRQRLEVALNQMRDALAAR